MEGLLLLAGATGLLTAFGALESFRHRRNLAKIPMRVHVNGTRGKSSVTRLIAAGLRAGGIRTFAKTTGTLPRMILPDGTEDPIERNGRPNIIEQVQTVRTAVDHRAEALVLECMALQPLLQSLCELKIVRSTHGVVTNARPDHLDVMGPDSKSVARALAGTTPVSGRMYTAEQTHLDVFDEAARDRDTALVPVGDDDVAAVSWEEMKRFSHIEHPDNVALALRVCGDLGVDRQTALHGMWDAQPDPGVITTHQVDVLGRRILFVNGFAANDPQSTESNWNLAMQLAPSADTRIALLNCRSDRIDRTLQLAEMCARSQSADHYVLIGSGTSVFARRATSLGLNQMRIRVAEDWPAERICDETVSLTGRSGLVMGMGNIAGVGMDVIRCFQQRSLTMPAMMKEAA